MQTAALIASGLLLLLTLGNFVLGLVFARVLIRPTAKPQVPDSELPKAAVFLSLRGFDPYLPETIRRLTDQDYPDYTISVVVDNANDAAWDAINAVSGLDQLQRVSVTNLKERSSTCSRKCGALVQMLQEMQKDREIVAVLDGDAIIHREWLRRLAQPFRDPQVGVTFGNRWFLPKRGQWGSALRSVWNVSSVVVMYFQSIPWGGSFAIRKSLLDAVQLEQIWSRSIADDATVRSAVLPTGSRIQFVPEVMVVNEEECSVPTAFRYFARQMAWTRFYVPANFAGNVFTWLAIFALVAVVAAAAVRAIWDGQISLAAFWLATIGSTWSAQFALWYMFDRIVRNQCRRRNELVAQPRLSTFARIAVGIPVVFGMHLVALLIAQCKRTFDWRGVRYRLLGPQNVQILEDRTDWLRDAKPADESL